MTVINGNINGVHEPSSADLFSQEYAAACDKKDPLRHFRSQFIVPSRADLKRKSDRIQPEETQQSEEECTYLCGNSLGIQPRVVNDYVAAQLVRWRTKGVYGHFKEIKDSLLPPWLNLDDEASTQSAHLVGAQPSECVVMQTLTANIHLLLASFYRPNKDRYKIIIESKAFPSDHYAVESQIYHHDLSPANAMVLVEPLTQTYPLIETSHILSVIDDHASSTALLLLPGIQYYTGQLLDMKTITAYAQSKGIIVGWDLAHAVGNVPLKLREWNVDFAAWCNYKYMNCGPGATGGLFIAERHTAHGASSANGSGEPNYRHRLAGWWGNDKSTRFEMTNEFIPISGARGFQLSNPSALDLAAVLASLSIFAQTDMESLRAKSLKLTAYLEQLLHRATPAGNKSWKIITPADPAQRGAQLSVQLENGLLDHIMEELEDKGVVLDERKPDVIRVAPAPLYNSFEDVRRFAEVFFAACDSAVEAKRG